MGELVEGALDAEVGREGEREDDRVRRQVAAGVVADEQDAALLGDVAQPAHLAAEVQRGQQPQPRQALADVVGVALVEVGGRDPARPTRPLTRAEHAQPSRPPPPSAVPGARPRAAGGRAACRRAAVGACRGRSVGRSRALTPASSRARARAERVDAGEEAPSRPLVCSGRSTWGTWPQPSSTICSARGQPALDVAPEAGRDQLVVGAPDEHAPAAASSASRG